MTFSIQPEIHESNLLQLKKYNHVLSNQFSETYGVSQLLSLQKICTN